MVKSSFTNDMQSVFSDLKSSDLNSLPDKIHKLTFSFKNYTKNTYNFGRIDHEGNVTNKHQINPDGGVIEGIDAYELDAWVLLKENDEKCALLVFPKCTEGSNKFGFSILKNELIGIDEVPENVDFQCDRLTQVFESNVNCKVVSGSDRIRVETMYNCKTALGKKFQVVYWEHDFNSEGQLGQDTYKLLRDKIEKIKILKKVDVKVKDDEENTTNDYEFEITNKSSKVIVISNIDATGTPRFMETLDPNHLTEYSGKTTLDQAWVISDESGWSTIWITPDFKEKKPYKYTISYTETFEMEVDYLADNCNDYSDSYDCEEE